MLPVVLSLLSLGAVAEKPRLVVLGITSFDASTARRAEELGELALTELSRSGEIEVIGQSDLTSLLGLERQKRLLGCEDTGACMAEIGAALGAPYLLTGSIGRAGKQLRVDLKLIDVTASRVLAREGEVVEGDDAWYPRVTAMLRRLQLALPKRTVASERVLSPWPWVLAGVGVAGTATGGALMIAGAGDARRALEQGRGAAMLLAPQVSQRYEDASRLHDVGVGLVIGGAAVAVAGLVIGWMAGTGAPPPVAVVPSRTGTFVVMQGTF